MGVNFSDSLWLCPSLMTAFQRSGCRDGDLEEVGVRKLLCQREAISTRKNQTLMVRGELNMPS
jgi:hypothetical protein